MKEKLTELIKKSSILKEGDKAMYLAMLDSLSEEKMADLFAILEKESLVLEEIEAQTENKTSDANKEYMEEIKSTYKEEKSEAIDSIEADDSKKADQMISNL